MAVDHDQLGAGELTISITLQGAKELTAGLDKMSGEIVKAVEDAVTATGLELRGEIIEAIQSGPASGHVYEKYTPRRTHQASAAGEAPMSDTGRLAGSVTFNRESDLTVTVGSNLVYAAWLEFGTIKMAPRPVWQPKAEEMAPKFAQRLERAILGAIK